MEYMLYNSVNVVHAVYDKEDKEVERLVEFLGIKGSSGIVMYNHQER
jgi:hypothetical protein